jgi:hypothetical protein
MVLYRVGVYYSSTALYFLSVGFMVGRGHVGQVFISHKNFWPPLFSCTKISDPPHFPPAPPPPSLVINDRSLIICILYDCRKGIQDKLIRNLLDLSRSRDQRPPGSFLHKRKDPGYEVVRLSAIKNGRNLGSPRNRSL